MAELKMSEATDNYFRQLIEATGAQFVGIQGGCIYFRDANGGPVLRLFCFAATRETILLSLKNSRERATETPAWEKVGR